MKTILLTNDDGYDSKGLLALKEALCEIANICIVAPSTEKSACGHGLSLTKPLRFVKIQEDFYKLDDGTPADCIYLALNTLYKDKHPDLIVSGINLGSNMGEDITYSGTVAGAMEGVIHGIPSVAISQVIKDKSNIDGFDFALAKQSIFEIVSKIFEGGFPLEDRKFLNINIPQILPSESKGYQITQKGYRIYSNQAHFNTNPRGQGYYWLGLHPLAWNERKKPTGMLSDFGAVSKGYVSITPITLDMTSYEDINSLSLWLK
ncbi:5'/3'-nucleotidase SurE [Helicobacter cappadocius]|uniref:5'-nucleotidase SurE n=1 Tax=Helicobacter cappadocius TaxID=3063998 RepID=A0AA90PS21_9HELI|nr:MULTISPECIES: 5'/3'-nucleotidase SurE [unclassified Helicobacter]MDO7252557.1 5'/3'-nucleotidase SurE [Helicobacter sp. faydin-H75]MDP2538424.1 5'/3'-nucleotidase SurE [Helicobacter sp. faydin-H76]